MDAIIVEKIIEVIFKIIKIVENNNVTKYIGTTYLNFSAILS